MNVYDCTYNLKVKVSYRKIHTKIKDFYYVHTVWLMIINISAVYEQYTNWLPFYFLQTAEENIIRAFQIHLHTSQQVGGDIFEAWLVPCQYPHYSCRCSILQHEKYLRRPGSCLTRLLWYQLHPPLEAVKMEVFLFTFLCRFTGYDINNNYFGSNILNICTVHFVIPRKTMVFWLLNSCVMSAVWNGLNKYNIKTYKTTSILFSIHFGWWSVYVS